jgi:hypothetical protein
MQFDTFTFLPIIQKLGVFLKQAGEHYDQLSQVGTHASPEVISAFLQASMDNWNPKIKGVQALDPETKQAAARFLGGVAYNLAAGNKNVSRTAS